MRGACAAAQRGDLRTLRDAVARRPHLLADDGVGGDVGGVGRGRGPGGRVKLSISSLRASEGHVPKRWPTGGSDRANICDIGPLIGGNQCGGAHGDETKERKIGV